MSDPADREPEPPRLLESNNAFERLLVRSAELDDAELRIRQGLREATAAGARQALRQSRSRGIRIAAGVGLLAAAAGLALLLGLSKTATDTPQPTAEPAPLRPAPSAATSAGRQPAALERCRALVSAKGEAPLIDDFEDRNARLLLRDGRSGSWLTNGDPQAKQQPRAGTPAFPVALSPARGSSRQALHLVGGQLTATAGVDARLAPDACYDASSYSGVELWAKGPGRVYVALPMVDTVERKWGGLCDTGCYDPHRAAVDLGRGWQHVAIKWEDLQQAGYGAPLRFDEKRLASVQIMIDPVDSPFDVWLDDVAFLPR